MTYDWAIVQNLPGEAIEVVPPLREAWRETAAESSVTMLKLGTVIHLADMTDERWRDVVVDRLDDGSWRIRLFR